MLTVDNWATAKQYQKHGQDNIEFAKECLDKMSEYPESKDFYSFHFLGHINHVLFWAQEIEDELGRSKRSSVQETRVSPF